MERGLITDKGKWICREKFLRGIVHVRIYGHSLPFCVHKGGEGFEVGEKADDGLLYKLGLLTRYFLAVGTLLEIGDKDYLKAT
ncbi:MAG: hypothetical protein UX59_C0022G0009 [Microgenomates group bacterium GW2011_GWA1_46_7]|nr:MAG: hypothetical protein UX59_C0022G0009 [Microgenomates group bacterium GW2011_GWA1_46_7]